MKELRDTKAEGFFNRKERDGEIKIRTYDLSEYVLKTAGLFLARAMPFPGIAPFGLAFLAMEREISLKSLISFIMITAGYLTLGFKASIGYIIASVIFMGFMYFAGKEKEVDLKIITIAMSMILTVVNIGGMFWLGIDFENIIMTMLDAGLLIMGITVFDKCRNFTNGKNQQSVVPSRDEKLCLCVMAGIALLSFRDIYIIPNYSIANTAGFLMVGIGAASGGLLSGTISGIITGLLLGTNSDILTYLGVFSIVGLTCGVCARYGKYGVGAGLLVSGMLISAYAMGDGSGFIRFYEVPAAAVVIAVLPEKFYGFVGRFSNFGGISLEGDNPYKLHARTKLALAAESFRNLAETFVRISDKEKDVDIYEIGVLFDTAADKVCRSCSEVNRCWKREYNSTYKTMFRFLEILERKRVLSESDADPHFAARCLRLRQLVRELNKQFELYKLNQIWKSKLSENRELVGEQFSGVAEILDKISDELDRDSMFDNMAAEEIQCRLKSKGIVVNKVQVSRDFEGRHRVQLYMKKKDGQIDGTVIAAVLKSVLGVGFSCDNIDTVGKDSRMILQYYEIPTLRIVSGYVCAGKTEECGDSHTLSTLRGGKYIATLSDGMGTGSRAGRESNAIVGLLEGFMDAGFDKEVAVKLINSAMVMKSVGEAFATVDMCMIDLYTGEAEFIKNGAEPSYIKRKNGTETVRAASLPVGVMSGVEIESFAHKLTEGDMVVMVSDGLELKNGHEGWLRKTVEQAREDIPVQELAHQIMDKSIALKGGTADDDMTVIVLRLVG